MLLVLIWNCCFYLLVNFECLEGSLPPENAGRDSLGDWFQFLQRSDFNAPRDKLTLITPTTKVYDR